MLRIVIVDDEILIRDGMARMISKENVEFQVVGIFPDGMQMLNKLPQLDIDVVITDIRMPQIDGLELIRELKVSHPHIRSILISGFVEFNYAREAIRCSAVDYLLKPINKEQLFELLYQLDEEKRIQADNNERQRSGLLLTLLQVEEPSAIFLDNFILPYPHFSIFVLKGSHPEAVWHATATLRQEKVFLFDYIEIQNGIHIWICYSKEILSSVTHQIIESYVQASSSDYSLHVGTSHSYMEVDKIRLAYLEAKHACDAGIYTTSTFHYAHVRDLKQSVADIAELFNTFRDSLIHELQILNLTGIMKELHNVFSAVRTQRCSTNMIISICRMVEETAEKELPEFEVIDRGNNAVGYKKIQSSMSVNEIETLFNTSFSAKLTEIRVQRLKGSDKAVEVVKRWITANYNQHAELNTLANMVYLTPSYLSKLFKQEIGLTLTDYIIEVRITKAKQLLRNSLDMKVHEIGAEVGYVDPAYFNKLFKRVVGITPNEYKRISI
ncbi:response regulator transcription factor [Paenibacillus antarcticus]|uniref:DNA-binding response regulator n=1 Tax=Paenibacillus antarcticus TaxID=253703 RepID=A0A162MFP3_9BACL|nr:response regulator [Paenibacillus antarcticus]OAB48205.1 hypothetical protein PBAT_00765 [Paenibacillus antarcticus]